MRNHFVHADIKQGTGRGMTVDGAHWAAQRLVAMASVFDRLIRKYEVV